MNPQTPPLAREYKETVHDSIVNIAADWFTESQHTLYMNRDERIEYSIHLDRDNRLIGFVLKPDIYVLWSTPVGPINLAVEVTTRCNRYYIPEEWLVAYSLGLYLRNLRPSFTLLVTLESIAVLPLSSKGVRKLQRLIEKGTNREPTPSLCHHCDLRQICPSPLV